MAADRPEGSNLERSIAKRMGNRLRRMFGMENLHDGSREQFEEAHESIPEGGRPLQADTTTGRTGTASSLPDAGLSRPWSSDFEPFPTPGAGGGQSQGISGGGGGGSAGTGVEAEGLAGVAGANGGAAHTTPSGGSGPGHATASGGSGGTGGGGGAHNGPNGGTASPLSNASTGLKGETHRPITDDDERVTGDEDKPIQGTVIEHPISSEGKLLVLKSFSIEGFPATHTPGTKPVSIPGIGSFLVDPLGNYTFTPAPNWHGQVPTIHYTVTDGYSTNNSALNINIKPVDDSFTDNSEKFVYDEDSGQHSGNLLKGSSSPDGSLSIKSFSVDGQQGTLDQPFVIQGKGTLTIHQDGTFEFQSAPNYNGPIPQATYTVTDGSGKDVQSTLNINIKPVDDSFTDNSEKFVYDEDSGQHSGNLLKGSSSPDGSLSIKSFSVDGQQGTLDQPFVIQGKGTLTIHQDGTFEFQSAPNYNGPIPQATYTVTDGSGKDVQSTLNINIKPVDDSFTDNSEKFVYDEDSGQHSGNLLKGSSSPDGSLSIKSFSVDGQQGTLDQPFVIQGKGTLTIHQDGTFEFQSAPNYNGPIPQATYTVTDGSGKDVQSTLNINIKPVDDSFTDNSEKFVYDEDSGQHSGNLLKGSSSPDGSLSIKSFSVDGQQGTLDQPFVIQGKGTLTIHQDGTFEFQSAPNYNGPIPQATYTVTDGSGKDVQSTLNINIKPVDDSFTDNSEKFVYDEDSGQHSGNLLKGSSSPDGTLSIKSFSVDGQQGTLDQPFVIQGKGTLTIHQDGTFEFQSAPNYNGPIPQATYTVTDGSGKDVQSTLNINIKPVDDSFTDNSEKFVYDEDSGQHSGNLLKGSSSPDGTLSIKSFSVDGQQGTLDQPFVIQGKGTLTIHQDGTFEFQSAPNYNGPIPQATYTVTDGSGKDVQSTLNINIKPVDDPSLLTDDSKTIAEGSNATGNVLSNDSDVDNSLTVSSFTVAGLTGSFTAGQTATITGVGTITIAANGDYTFTPVDNDYNGTVPTVTYTTNTGSTANLDINVTPVDDPSLLTDDSKTVAEGSNATGNVLSNDSDVDNSLTVSSFTVAGLTGSFTAGQTATITGVGTITIAANGDYTFTPVDNDYNGTVPTVTYTTNTGSTANLDINVTPVDDPFSDDDESNSGDKGKQIAGSVLAGTSSPDGPVTIQSFSINGNNYTAGTITKVPGVGFLVINNDGSYVFRPDGNFTGDAPPIKYTATDGSSTDQSTLQLTVNPDPLPAFSDAGEKYSMKLGTPRLERNLLDNTSIQQSGGQKITVSISDFNIEGQNYQPGQTAHLSCGALTVKQDGSLIFVPAKGFSGSVPQLTYHLTDGTHSGQTSTADIQVNPYQLVDADEWIRGQEGQVISGELTDGAHLDNGGTPQHLEITQVLDPAGKPLNRDAASGHFVGEIHDENNAIAGTLDVDPATGHYTFTPSSHWTGNIGTSNLPPISYLVRDENGVQDGSLLGIKIDPSWVTPPITDHTQIKPGTNAGTVQVGAGEPGTYYLAKEGERFDPNHPQSTVHGEIGDLSVNSHGQVSFTYDAQRGKTWSQDPNNQNSVHMQTIEVNTGAKTGTALGAITNPGGRALGVPGFSHGNAWWKHPITGETIQRPPEQSTGTLGFVERWVVYNAKGEVVGHYYVTADLKLTETVTHNYSGHRETGHGPPRWVISETSKTTSTEAIITHIHAGAEAPTAQERAQNSGTANDAPDGSESGINDPTQAYADYFAAIALLSEETQDALKELHLHSAKLVVDEDLKETIIAETDQGELRLHISDGLRLDTTSLNKDFLLTHPDINIAASRSQEEETNSQTADSHPASEPAFAGNTEGSISEESGSTEQQEPPSQSATGVEAANLAAALNKIKDNIHFDTDGAKPGTAPEDIRDAQEPIENSGTTNTDNAPEQTAAANSGMAAEASQTDGSLLQRLVQKVQNTIAGPTEEAANPEAQDVATSTLLDPFSEPKQVQPPDDLSSSEPAEDYQPLLDPQDNPDQLM